MKALPFVKGFFFEWLGKTFLCIFEIKMSRRGDYIEERISNRQLLVDVAARLGKKIPHIYSIWELEITKVREDLKSFNSSNNSRVSLYTFLLYAYVKTIVSAPSYQAIHSGRSKKRTYQSIDIFFPIELSNGELRLHIIRNCQKKNLLEIQEELQSQMKREPKELPWNVRLFLTLPKFIRNWISDITFLMPSLRKELYGTAYFTALKTVANTPGIGIPLPLNTIGMLIGHLFSEKTTPETEIKRTLSITISADHRIINGGQLVKFCNELRKNIETSLVEENWSNLD